MNDHEESNSVPGIAAGKAAPQLENALNQHQAHASIPRTLPAGVVVVVVLLLIHTLFYCLLSYGFNGISEGLGYITIGFLLLLALNICIAVGLCRLRTWAWVVTIIEYGLYFGVALDWLLLGSVAVADVVNLLLPIAVIVYLMRPHVIKAFR